ncbi:hypothetical protein [Bradymonas sediminis]|uniref:Uncharacterized protein n=1 Tax=Bradymonas sediminis TaxID=1548548 RepID=A0A2Z4FH83_9DELT|nr:hypothetical protein [Bradymonas sediminis]AWV88269.1 hypothetical protein DN745_02505 [Bradymonas sediminis]TDP77393.1 hypothetical protein DFR33_101293 [Bradymonas sediminis]
MAITPRTVLSQPISFTVFSLASIGLVAVLGIILGAQRSQPAQPPAYSAPLVMPAPTHSVTRLSYHSPEPPCDLTAPERQWSAAKWVRHLDCMEARSYPNRVLLGEANKAISRVGLKPALALRKSDYLKAIAPLEQQIDFLRSAVNGLGVVEGKLVHRLRRALVWRAKESDLDEIRSLEDLSSRLPTPAREDLCEVRQTDIWTQFLIGETLESPGIEDGSNSILRSVADQSVQRAIRTYIALDCIDQIHEGERESLAELAGVAIAAEASNGHSGQSTLLRKMAASYQILNIPEFCRQAVPANIDLRQTCEKRVGDELYLAR